MKVKFFILLLPFIYIKLNAVFYRLDCNALLLDKTINIAKNQVGLIELTGNNDGDHIERYLLAVGLNPKRRYSYCAAGIYWCFLQAQKLVNFPIPIKKTGLANEIFFDARRRGIPSTRLPRKGDLLVWYIKNSSRGHIEIIFKSIGNGIYQTIGFNTNGVKGQGNYYKLRSLFNPIGKLNIRGVVQFKRWI